MKYKLIPVLISFVALNSAYAAPKTIGKTDPASLCMSLYNLALSKDFAIGLCMEEGLTSDKVSAENKASPDYCVAFKAACNNVRPKYTKAYSKKFSCSSRMINQLSNSAKTCTVGLSSFRQCLSNVKTEIGRPSAIQNFCEHPTDILSYTDAVTIAENSDPCVEIRDNCNKVYNFIF